MGGDNRGVLGEVGTAATELRVAVSEVRQLITNVDGSVVQLSATTLPEINAALGSIQEAADALDSLSTEIRQDPRGALSRPTGREVEIPR